MTDHDHIDQLFRDTLREQDLPVDAQAMQQAMSMLEANRRRATLLKWTAAALLLVVIGSGAYWYCAARQQEKAGAAIASVEQTKKEESTSAQIRTEEAEDEQRTATTATDEAKQNETAQPVQPSSEKTEVKKLNEHTEKKQSAPKQTKASIQPDKKMVERNMKDQRKPVPSASEEDPYVLLDFLVEKNKEVKPSSTPPTATTHVPSEDKASTNSTNSSEEPVTMDAVSENEKPLTQQHIKSFKEIIEVSKGTDREATTPTTTTAFEASKDSVEVLAQENAELPKQLAPDSAASNSNTIKNLPISKWSIGLGFTAGQVSGTLKSNNSEQAAYFAQRNQQESPLIGLGADVMLTRHFSRSQFSFGLGLMKTGEDIQYSGLITNQNISSSATWSYETITLMIIDGTPQGEVYIMDTTYLSFIVDSTTTLTYDTTSTLSENKAIAERNGPTSLVHITLPVGYGFQIARWNKSSLHLNAWLESTYLIQKRAYYLHPNGESLLSISDDAGQRSFMLNAAISAEWRRGFAQNKMYLSVQPGFRANLYSWNSAFTHRYYMPYLRAGVGFRF